MKNHALFVIFEKAAKFEIVECCKEFLAIRRATSLNKTFVYFVEIMTGDTRHTQQIHIDEPSIYPCPLVCLFKTGFSKCM